MLAISIYIKEYSKLVWDKIKVLVLVVETEVKFGCVSKLKQEIQTNFFWLESPIKIAYLEDL